MGIVSKTFGVSRGLNMNRQLFRSVAVSIVCLLALRTATAAADCSETIPEVFQKIAPSVVYISAVSIDPFKVTERIIGSSGSGFIIDPDGLILTNSHLVYGYQAITVTTETGQIVMAEMVAEDRILDIAILRIPTPLGGFPAVTFGDSKKIRVGEQVSVIGNPLGLEQTLTVGVISGINRVLPAAPMSLKLPLIQTDAAINPGNSGGPLVNSCGEVIGINTATFLEAENMGFALPIHIVKDVLEELLEKGRVVRPWVGVAGQLVRKELSEIINLPVLDGFLVETVEAGSPAEKAGLKGGILPVTLGGLELLLGGDIIVEGNGRSFGERKNFVEFVRGLKVGDEVKLTVFHEGETRQVSFRLPERPN